MRGSTSFLSILPMWSRCSPVSSASSSRVMNLSARICLRLLPIFTTPIVGNSMFPVRLYCEMLLCLKIVKISSEYLYNIT